MLPLRLLSAWRARNPRAGAVLRWPCGSSFVVTYPEGGASMAGWYLRTLSTEGSQGRDPSYFNVWATNEDLDDVVDWSCALGRDDDRWWVGGEETEWCGAKWRRVGGTHWRWRGGSFATAKNHGHWWDFVQVEITLPTARDALEPWHLIPDGLMYLPWWTVNYFIFGPACLCAAHARQMITGPSLRFIPSPQITLAIGLACSCTITLVGVFYAASMGADHIALEFALGILAQLSTLVAFMFTGNIFVIGIWGYGVIRIVTEIGFSCWYFHTAMARPPTVGILVLGLAVFVTVSRIKAIYSSKKLLAQDELRYDALWKSLHESEDGKTCISHLEKVVRMIGLDATNNCRQQKRLRADKLAPAVRAKYLSQVSRRDLYPLFWDVGHWYIPGRPDPKSKVSSMNQLYAQSAIATLLLDERIQAWADRSSGMVRMRANGTVAGGQQEYARWSDVKNDPELVKRVKWPGMKRHTRALEKLFRSYENDPSLLLDISRNCLVFQNMSDLTNCLGLIITDDNVRVERLKNRMSPDFDTSETGGYRDVCINLKVVNKEAGSLGAELAVCEVQLMLESFARLKTKEGHHRYVLSRNSRGT
mmetsp:Transcript_17254/g.41547  ORF Transcript_17254/g.41547 Transcript_17254/m.41547 type:complete len:590 (-) Transcript_17254:133-1902(-)